MRLSRGSLDVHTAHRQPIVGTPMEVPEPRTVNRNLPVNCGVVSNEFEDMFPVKCACWQRGRASITLALGFCCLSGLGCLSGQRLIHFKISHL